MLNRFLGPGLLRVGPLVLASVGALALARWLGAADFGRYSVLVAIGGLCGRTGSGALTQNLMANISTVERSAGSIGTRAAVQLGGLALPWIGGATATAWLGAYLFTNSVALASCAAVLALTWSVAGITSGLARALRREMLGIALLPGAASLIGLGGLVAMAVVEGFDSPFVWSFAAYSLAVAGTGGVFVVVALRATVSGPGESASKLSTRASLEYGLTQLAVNLYLLGDVWLLGALPIPSQDVGAYSAAKRIAGLVGLPGALVALLVAPEANLKRSADGFDNERAVAASRAAANLGAAAAIVAVVAAVFVADGTISSVLGPSFSGAGLVLIAVLIGQLCSLATGSVRVFLLQSGHRAVTMMVEYSLLVIASVSVLLASPDVEAIAIVLALVAALRFAALSLALYRIEKLWVGVQLGWVGRTRIPRSG